MTCAQGNAITHRHRWPQSFEDTLPHERLSAAHTTQTMRRGGASSSPNGATLFSQLSARALEAKTSHKRCIRRLSFSTPVGAANMHQGPVATSPRVMLCARQVTVRTSWASPVYLASPQPASIMVTPAARPVRLAIAPSSRHRWATYPSALASLAQPAYGASMLIRQVPPGGLNVFAAIFFVTIFLLLILFA